jgi:hypothetical protein
VPRRDNQRDRDVAVALAGGGGAALRKRSSGRSHAASTHSGSPNRDGLVWLADADTPASSWDHDDVYEDRVGSLLDAVDRHSKGITRSAARDDNAYCTLLARLADRRVPIARELISRMSAPGGS